MKKDNTHKQDLLGVLDRVKKKNPEFKQQWLERHFQKIKKLTEKIMDING